ncbi:hypothetical protein BKM14_19475 [Pseudomonas syringae pv. syringae]|nr:hypothetical protein BKM14_19475 [Pseudomonas syringae pv. syringae]
MKINTSFSWGCEKGGERCASAAASSEPFRASNTEAFAGIGWGSEHAHLDARFQFLVRLGHLLGQHLLADDVRNARNDLIRHQKPGITKPA